MFGTVILAFLSFSDLFYFPFCLFSSFHSGAPRAIFRDDALLREKKKKGRMGATELLLCQFCSMDRVAKQKLQCMPTYVYYCTCYPYTNTKDFFLEKN